MKTLQQLFLSERNIMIAIILNAIVIFLLYFPEFHRHPVLEWIDHFFIIVFLLEAIVKMSTWGMTVYFSSRWNVFDFTSEHRAKVIADIPDPDLIFAS